MRRICSTATIAALLVCVVGMSSDSDPGPQEVAFTTVVSYLPEPSFTWTGTGAIGDGGTLEFLIAHWGGVPSPAVGALRLTVRFHGTAGTFDLQMNLLVTAAGPPGIYNFDGPWVIVDSAGVYAGMRGNGSAHITGRVDQLSDAQNPEIGTFTGRLRSPQR